MSKLRILKYNVNELVIDHDAIADNLNEACHRNGVDYKLIGIFQNRWQVIFSIEPCKEIYHYNIDFFMGPSEEDIIADIYSHWQSDIQTLGMIRVNDEYLGVFEKVAE